VPQFPASCICWTFGEWSAVGMDMDQFLRAEPTAYVVPARAEHQSQFVTVLGTGTMGSGLARVCSMPA
jgi:hypothetical protein